MPGEITLKQWHEFRNKFGPAQKGDIVFDLGIMSAKGKVVSVDPIANGQTVTVRLGPKDKVEQTCMPSERINLAPGAKVYTNGKFIGEVKSVTGGPAPQVERHWSGRTDANATLINESVADSEPVTEQACMAGNAVGKMVHDEDGNFVGIFSYTDYHCPHCGECSGNMRTSDTRNEPTPDELAAHPVLASVAHEIQVCTCGEPLTWFDMVQEKGDTAASALGAALQNPDFGPLRRAVEAEREQIEETARRWASGIAEGIKYRRIRESDLMGPTVTKVSAGPSGDVKENEVLSLPCPDCPNCDLPDGWTVDGLTMDVLFHPPFSEAMYIRLVCKNCKTVVELPLAK